MRHGLFVIGLLSVGVACGGSVGDLDADVGEAGSSGVGGRVAGGATSSGGAGAAPSGGAPGTGGAPFVEEPCPDIDPPEPILNCDPLSPLQGCGPGYGCYASLEYPTERCGFSRYVATCRYAGSGQQGELCGYLDDCAPGFMCVVGAATGARCGKLCSLSGPSGCSNGLLCGETDVPGVGVCY